MLTTKSVGITGSTGGIGLAIARALAGAGCDVMLNGFGDAAEIESVRRGIVQEYERYTIAPVIYLAADAAAPITGNALIMDGGWTAQ